MLPQGQFETFLRVRCQGASRRPRGAVPHRPLPADRAVAGRAPTRARGSEPSARGADPAAAGQVEEANGATLVRRRDQHSRCRGRAGSTSSVRSSRDRRPLRDRVGRGGYRGEGRRPRRLGGRAAWPSPDRVRRSAAHSCTSSTPCRESVEARAARIASAPVAPTSSPRCSTCSDADRSATQAATTAAQQRVRAVELARPSASADAARSPSCVEIAAHSRSGAAGRQPSSIARSTRRSTHRPARRRDGDAATSQAAADAGRRSRLPRRIPELLAAARAELARASERGGPGRGPRAPSAATPSAVQAGSAADPAAAGLALDRGRDAERAAHDQQLDARDARRRHPGGTDRRAWRPISRRSCAAGDDCPVCGSIEHPRPAEPSAAPCRPRPTRLAAAERSPSRPTGTRGRAQPRSPDAEASGRRPAAAAAGWVDEPTAAGRRGRCGGAQSTPQASAAELQRRPARSRSTAARAPAADGCSSARRNGRAPVARMRAVDRRSPAAAAGELTRGAPRCCPTAGRSAPPSMCIAEQLAAVERGRRQTPSSVTSRQSLGRGTSARFDEQAGRQRLRRRRRSSALPS